MSTKEIVDNAVGQLSTTIANISLELLRVASQIGSEAEAAEFIKAVKAHEDCLPRDTIKEIITDLAMKFQVYVYLGDYGNGESLQLEDSSWYGTSAGDWVSSSESC